MAVIKKSVKKTRVNKGKPAVAHEAVPVTKRIEVAAVAASLFTVAIKEGFDRVVDAINVNHKALMEQLTNGDPMTVLTYSLGEYNPEDDEDVGVDVEVLDEEEPEEEEALVPAKKPARKSKSAPPIAEEKEEDELDEAEIEEHLSIAATTAERKINKRLKSGDLAEITARRGYVVKNKLKLPRGLDIKKATAVQLADLIHDDFVDRAVAVRERELGLVR